jgi:hypothetical protein
MKILSTLVLILRCLASPSGNLGMGYQEQVPQPLRRL